MKHLLDSMVSTATTSGHRAKEMPSQRSGRAAGIWVAGDQPPVAFRVLRCSRPPALAMRGSAAAAGPKPLIGLPPAWPGALGPRALDRLGAGSRSAPRDALVAASADDASRGKAFGLEGLGDNFGAFLGPLLALVLLAL